MQFNFCDRTSTSANKMAAEDSRELLAWLFLQPTVSITAISFSRMLGTFRTGWLPKNAENNLNLALVNGQRLEWGKGYF